MKKLVSYLIFVLSIVVHGMAYAEKPPLVLLPIQGKGLTAQDRENYRLALQESLSIYYSVYSGDIVKQKLRKYSQKTCSAAECLQEVAIAFQGEHVGRLVVTPNGYGYLLGLEIKNIFDDEIIESQNIPCEGCDNFEVINRLKEVVLVNVLLPDGKQDPRLAEKDDEFSMPWWGWVLGAVVLGAAAGGGGGSDPASGTTETGSVTVTWQ